MFGRKKPIPAQPAASAASPASPASASQTEAEMKAQIMREAIARAGATDPLIGAKLASQSVLDRTVAALKNEQGVQVEALLTVLGALAGRACQVAAIDGLTRQLPEYAGLSLADVAGANGDHYFFGDAINRPLAESHYSVWGLVGASVQQLGGTIPDIADIFGHVAGSVGGPSFGIPRYSAGKESAVSPVQALALWDPMLPIIRETSTDIQQLPIVYGLAIQKALAMTGGQFDLTELGRITMDSAIAMAKLRVV